MGMWDWLRSIPSNAWYWNSPDSPSESNGVPYFNNLPEAVAKIGNIVGTQKLEDYVPNPDHREKIKRILYGLGKLAVDSAINESFKGITGGVQVYKIVKEGLKDQSQVQFAKGNNNPEQALAIVEMQAKIGEMQVKMEKMQEELSFAKQQNRISTQCAKELNFLKLLKERLNGNESDNSKKSSDVSTDAVVHPKAGLKEAESHEEANEGR